MKKWYTQNKIFGLIISFAVCALLWAILALTINKPFLPGPFESFKAYFEGMLGGKLLRHSLVSGYRVLFSILISFIFAMPLGIIIGKSERLDNLFSPLIHFLYPIPKVALLPVIVVLFGLGDFSKIFLISLVLFFQLLVVTRDAFKQIPSDYLMVSKSFSPGDISLWKDVYIPACMPQILTSLRVSVGTSIAILFFAESFASLSGLGYFISDAMSKRSYDEMYAGIIAMALLGLIFYGIISLLEKKIIKWKI